MNTWSPQQPQPVRPEPYNHVVLGVLIALDRRDTRDESTLVAAVTELHDARIELQASAAELRTATATLKDAARTLEQRATTVNILDILDILDMVTPPPPPLPPPPLTAPGSQPAVVCAGEGRCTIARGEFERLFTDAGQLVRQARIIPSIKDGRGQGMKLYAIRNTSFPAAIGLKNGDLLTAINGLPVLDVEAALAAYSALRTADALKFSIERKGQPMTMTLTLQIE